MNYRGVDAEVYFGKREWLVDLVCDASLFEGKFESELKKLNSKENKEDAMFLFSGIVGDRDNFLTKIGY